MLMMGNAMKGNGKDLCGFPLFPTEEIHRYGPRFAIERDGYEAIYKCTTCAHVYDSERDGDGLAFIDLP